MAIFLTLSFSTPFLKAH